MATMNIKVQHIDKVVPDINRNQGITISCDMDRRSMVKCISQIREQVTNGDFIKMLSESE